MNNARKRTFVSQRHSRRIIANNTEIDIAECHENILNQHINFSKDSFNLDLHDDTVEVDLHDNTAEIDSHDDIAKVDNYNLHSAKKAHIDPIFSRDHQFQNNNSVQGNSSNCIINEVNETDNINDENELRNAIATWTIFHNIPHNAGNDILRIFRQFTSYNLPADIRTLLQTPRKTDVIKICGGEYFYFGLKNIIQKMTIHILI